MATNGVTPATPPPSDPSTKPDQPSTNNAPKPDPEVPLTSAQDDGTSKRPRDARLIHVVLSSLGIHSYQERVPLQLLDFAYRYTSGVLNDSLRLSAEGYTNASGGGGGRKGQVDGGEGITVTALRQAIASRQGYTFSGPLPKEFMMQEAQDRNRIALPKVEKGYGVQLPPEKYCLTGVGWGIKNEWESEEDDDVMETGGAATMVRSRSGQGAGAEKEDEAMGGMDVDEDEEGAGRMEDVFGEGGDTSMAQD